LTRNGDKNPSVNLSIIWFSFSRTRSFQNTSRNLRQEWETLSVLIKLDKNRSRFLRNSRIGKKLKENTDALVSPAPSYHLICDLKNQIITEFFF
jgi:hypothetical protein